MDSFEPFVSMLVGLPKGNSQIIVGLFRSQVLAKKRVEDIVVLGSF